MNVLFHYTPSPRLRARLDALSANGLSISTCAQEDDARFFALLPGTDVLWHVLRPVGADVIAAAPKLKLIQKVGVGVNTIDLEAARARSIPVCNMPGSNSRAVAEMTVLLILACLRLYPRLDRLARSGAWRPDPETQDRLTELAGKTVGLIGFGDIPRVLAPMLTAMGARVIYTARSAKDAPYPFRPLPALLSDADIVSVHAPLTDATRNLIDAAALARMKPGAILINTARGGVVDEAALFEALVSGRLGAAGLDVFAEEPARADNPLFALDTVCVAPHLAWMTGEVWDRSLDIAAANALAIRDGGSLRHRVA